MAGGLGGYKFDLLLDLYYLYTNQQAKMKKLKRFPTFFDLKTYAENALDGDLMNKVKIVEEFNKRIPEIVDKIYKRCNFGAGYADYIFTTTHKAKGIIFCDQEILELRLLPSLTMSPNLKYLESE